MPFDFKQRPHGPVMVAHPSSTAAPTPAQQEILALPGVVGCYLEGGDLRVLVSTAAALPRLPAQVDGLPVVAEVVGEIVAQ